MDTWNFMHLMGGFKWEVERDIMPIIKGRQLKFLNQGDGLDLGSCQDGKAMLSACVDAHVGSNGYITTYHLTYPYRYEGSGPDMSPLHQARANSSERGR